MGNWSTLNGRNPFRIHFCCCPVTGDRVLPSSRISLEKWIKASDLCQFYLNRFMQNKSNDTIVQRSSFEREKYLESFQRCPLVLSFTSSINLRMQAKFECVVYEMLHLVDVCDVSFLWIENVLVLAWNHSQCILWVCLPYKIEIFNLFRPILSFVFTVNKLQSRLLCHG